MFQCMSLFGKNEISICLAYTVALQIYSFYNFLFQNYFSNIIKINITLSFLCMIFYALRPSVPHITSQNTSYGA